MPISDVEKIVRKEPLDAFYDLGKELGRGKFAIVKRCTEKSTGTQYAAKILKKRRRGKSVREDILVEIDIMRQGMDHNRIIKLYQVFEGSNEFYIIIELATGGELFRVIAVDPLPEVKARDVVFQIMEGVQHLHSLNIVHMDLKPENLLLYRKGSLEIKIVDFGLAVQLQEGQEMKSLVGTAEYVSPEILSFEPLSTCSDMWSIGALTYALLAGYSPFQGETHQETFLNVSTCDYDFEDEVFDAVSADAKDFIEKLLVRTPRKRLTAQVCLQHPWMKAHKSSCTTNNLDGSMSSLDSALCMDSASSMEPSPVSSASSSFSPAPSATSRIGGSSSTTATTTTAANTAAVPSSTSSSAAASTEYSRPEDMKMVNEKLSQISKLATEQLIAETVAKPRPEGSPTSTASSTSTLKGEEVSEPVVVPVLESSRKDVKTAKPHEKTKPHELAKPHEVTDGKLGEKPTVKNATIDRSISATDKLSPREVTREKSVTERRTASFERTPLPSSPRLDKNGKDDRDKSMTERRTTSFEYTRKPSSPRPERSNREDVTSLDPKTIESMQKFQRLKERSRKRESESYVQPDSRLPEPESRRSSEGQRLTSHRQLNTKSWRKNQAVCAVEEKGETCSVLPEEDAEPPHSPSPLPPSTKEQESTPSPSFLLSPGTLAALPVAFITSRSPELKKRVVERPTSPSDQPRESGEETPTAKKVETETENVGGEAKTEAETAKEAKTEIEIAKEAKTAIEKGSGEVKTAIEKGSGEVKTRVVNNTEKEAEQSLSRLQQDKEEQKTITEEPEKQEEDERESARRERERAREERRKGRMVEERKKEEEKRRLLEEVERKREEEKKRMELERERAKEARWKDRERKLAQRDSSSGSSESVARGVDRNKWAWSVEARTTDVSANPNGERPPFQRADSSEKDEKVEKIEKIEIVEIVEKDVKTEQPTAKKTAVETTERREKSVRGSAASKSDKKSKSDFFQFCTDYSASKNGAKRDQSAPKSPKTSRHSPPQQQKSPKPKSPELDTVETNVASITSPPPLAEKLQSPQSSSPVPVFVISPSQSLTPTPAAIKSPTPEPRENRELTPSRRHRERSPVADMKQMKVNRRKTPVISNDALDAIMRGEVDEESASKVLHYATENTRPRQLESCPEEDEAAFVTPPQGKSPTPLIKEVKIPDSSTDHQYLAERRTGILPSALKDPKCAVSPDKRRVTLLMEKERTQSADFELVVSPEHSEISPSQTPSPSPDLFTKSFNVGHVNSAPKPEAISRLSVSSNYSSLSRSTPDLSEILGTPQKHKEARKVERSNSRRMGRSKMDSYVTSTDLSSSYYQAPASPHMHSGRLSTLPSRMRRSKMFPKWDSSKNNKVSS